MENATAPPTTRGWLTALAHSARAFRRWLRAFRRTRPFWGGLWLILGGWLVLRLAMVPASIVVVTGLSGFGGWLTGGGMILCGLGAWGAPSQRYVVGIVGVVLAITSLVVSNLGGFFVGMLLGIVGGTMVVSWGPKKSRRARAAGVDPATVAGPARSDGRPVPGPRPAIRRPAPGPRA